MARFIISTTGTLDPVIFYDLGYRTFYTASTLNFDLTDEYTLDEISVSQDIQNSISYGYITAKDEFGNTILSSLTVNITILSGGSNMNLSGSSYNLNNNIILNSVSANTLFLGGSQFSLTANSFSSLSATTFSAGTINSGSTNLYSIFAQLGQEVTAVQPGSNITTGGTATVPIINVVASPSFNALTLSGTGQFAGVTATSVSGGTISGGTLFSGSTNLYSIFQTIGGGGGSTTYVQPGNNITTGGTSTNPIINVVSSPLFTNISISGTGNANAFSATTLSGDGISLTGIKGAFGITIDNGINVVTSGQKGFLIAPYNLGITGWDIIANTSGNCVIDVWKNTTIPTQANTITGTQKPTLSNEQMHSNTGPLNTWTTGVTTGDVIAFNVISATTISRVTLTIRTIKK